MTCYRCGSEEGTESTLCPTCAHIRKQQRSDYWQNVSKPLPLPEQGSALSPDRKQRKSARRRRRLRVLLALSVVILLLLLGGALYAFLLYLDKSGAPLADSEANYLYERCVADLQSADLGAGSKSMAMNKLRELARSRGRIQSSCALLRSTCAESPDGIQCRLGKRILLSEKR